MKKINYLFIAFLFLIFACNQDKENDKETEEDTTQTEQETSNQTTNVKAQEIKENVLNWRGGAFVKAVDVDNNTAVVLYVEDYDDYKATYPGSMFTEEDYDANFEKESEIPKIMVEVPVKIMKKFPDIEKVEMTLPFDNKIHKISISRGEVVEYTGTTFEAMQENWTANFADKHLFDEDGRNAYFEKFVEVEKK